MVCVRAAAEGVAIAERAALGTTARVAAWPPEDLDLALAAVDTELERLDRQASRFREDSELSRIHREPGPVHRLSRGLAEAISVALAAARWTGGLVDPTVGGALIALGYDRDFAAIGSAFAGAGGPAPAGGPGPAPGWRSVTLEGTVLGLAAGVRLDLGATAKGLGSDRAAAAAYRASGRGGILVSLGGDIAVAGQPPVGGWPVAVADSSDPGRRAPGQVVRLTAGALATSSVTGRRWRRNGRQVHHIIDPRTGWPAAGPWRTVSVAAPTAPRPTPPAPRRSWRGTTRKRGWPGPGCRPGWWPTTARCGCSAAGRLPTAAHSQVRFLAVCPARGPGSPAMASAAMTSAVMTNAVARPRGRRGCGSSRGAAGSCRWSC